MSKDLDKLMEKLKTQKVEEVPKETEELLSQEDQDDFEEEDEVDQGIDEDEDEVPTPAPAQEIKEIPKVEKLEVREPAQVDDHQENPIEAEVGLLQNNGVFRRELLLTLKELVDVQKVQAELMIKHTKEKK